MSWSIRTRLTAWYSAVVVTVLVAGVVVFISVQRRLDVQRIDGELRRLLLTLEGVMRTEFSEGLDLQAAADEASIEVVAPDRSLLLADRNRKLLAVWGRPLPDRWYAVTDGGDAIETVPIGNGSIRVVRERVVERGHEYVAAVLAPLDDVEQERAELLAALVSGGAVALVVAAVGGWVIGRQTLKPLSGMAAQATAITERDPSARLRIRNTGDELGTLAAAFNGLLDRLAAALHAQRQFMADAAHELRTPVSVVRTTAQVTLRREMRSESEYRESLAIVEEQSSRMARLVDAMFLLARAEARGIPLHPEPLYVDDLVTESARALRVLADERHITVRVEGDSEVSCSGDDTLLRQMIGNLLDNAIRHTRPGGTVTVWVQRHLEDVVIRVVDNGTGIPAADHERIFQRFVRLDTQTGGAGLGLPIARWIAEAHAGRLVLESSGDTGSVFTVTLPCDAVISGSSSA
jgi:heavy metal sensor kinase